MGVKWLSVAVVLLVIGFYLGGGALAKEICTAQIPIDDATTGAATCPIVGLGIILLFGVLFVILKRKSN